MIVYVDSTFIDSLLYTIEGLVGILIFTFIVIMAKPSIRALFICTLLRQAPNYHVTGRTLDVVRAKTIQNMRRIKQDNKEEFYEPIAGTAIHTRGFGQGYLYHNQIPTSLDVVNLNRPIYNVAREEIID